ncbi:MAG: hypothetical protein ACR2Q3_18225 [Woeseiaceae bacterium]
MNDFDKLKDLLFGAEKQALDSISERVERPETRAVDVADILPESIIQSHKKNSDLVESLKDPVGECVQKAFHEDPKTYGDALYPVIGPAIRKSISHTLRAISQQINQAVEQSLTPKGLSWRFQAYRAGIPFGEFVLQKTLLYRIEQAYLISRENGLLVEHVHHPASKIKDSDAVSAMFTAIQDFVKESFSPDRTGRLESADMGDFTLWAVHGPHALLVCVIRGVPPKDLRSHLSAILERIHFRYGDAIRNYSGDTLALSGVDDELQKCLSYQATQESTKKGRGFSRAAMFIGLLAVALIFLWLRSSWIESREIRDLTEALNRTSGLFLKDVTRNGDQILVEGMQDPLATPVSSIVESLGISPENVVTNLQSYQSLDPEIIRRRVDRHVRGFDTISYELSGTTLTFSGSAPAAWIEKVRTIELSVAGIDNVDTSSVVNTDLESLRQELESLTGSRFIFSNGVDLAGGQETALRNFAQRIAELQALAAASGHRIQIDILGTTDSSGTVELNTSLAVRRGTATSAILSEYDVSGNVIRDSDEAIADTRAANVTLTLVPISDRP